MGFIINREYQKSSCVHLPSTVNNWFFSGLFSKNLFINLYLAYANKIFQFLSSDFQSSAQTSFRCRTMKELLLLTPQVVMSVVSDLKIVPAPFLLVYFVCPKESSCEIKKDVFYFTSKALFEFRS